MKRIALALLLFASLQLCMAREKNPTPTVSGSSFIETETSLIRSALVFEVSKNTNRTRRGGIIPIDNGYWACFDPDLLRWSAIWRAPNGQSPLSYDSMAAISFPDAKAKASKPPSLLGEIILHTPELPGVSIGQLPSIDPRKNFLTDGKTPVGPLPLEFGKWLGNSLYGKVPVIQYQIGKTRIHESLCAAADGSLQRCLQLEANNESLTFRLGSQNFKTESSGAEIIGDTLQISPSTQARQILIFNSPTTPKDKLAIVKSEPATPVFPTSIKLTNPSTTSDGPFTIRNITLPTKGRPIRPTDIAFLSDGTALLCSLDGDIWKITDIQKSESTWTRVATGLFEPMSIATDKDNRIFVLGRDQITELIDTNKDGHFDIFCCATDSFLQTLHTRDYATSFEIDRDGSFLIAKGGIDKEGGDVMAEISPHRGTIIRISPNDEKVETLADGLRMPFVGLRNDGAVFVSDQQGNHVPSTPIHLIGTSKPYLGFAPTNFRSSKKLIEPLLYYPYQTNRSAAGFATISTKAFPDLPNAFLQISWNGRLFAIATPTSGQAFSWQLPLQISFPTLNAATHPISGRLYTTGIGISGYAPTTPNLLGLASIEQSNSFPTPSSVNVSATNIQITFSRPFEITETIVPASPTLRLFNVKRTPAYGSGHFKWDGKPGEHTLQPNNFSLSPDRRSLTLNFDIIRKSDILDLHLIISSGNITFPLHIFTRPSHLAAASSSDLASIEKSTAKQPQITPGDPTKGKPLFTQYACSGCHSLNNEKLTGPPLNGIASRSNKKELHEAILNPNAKITEGYPPSMPSFAGVISEQDLEHLITYLQTLKN